MRTGIREGGDTYLFATTDLRGRLMVLVCEKSQTADFSDWLS
ncbi:hypothetical protein [Hymenobacter sp. HDW8]|nr:hypothetical protein [Hymenobacter sp. HDW8]